MPEVSILGPLHFVMYVNDIPETLSCPSEKFADNMLLCNSDSMDTISVPVQQGLCEMSN